MFLICLKIFCARIIDVSLGTLRTNFFVRGKVLAPFIIAFFEVLIWYFVAREAINTNYNIYLVAIFYAFGYATGTLIGILISKVLLNGYMCIQVITKDSEKIANILRSLGYGVSILNLKSSEDKDMLYIEVEKRNLKEVLNIINKHTIKPFIIINETKYIQNGIFK